MPKTTFSVAIDDRLDGTLSELQRDLGKPSKAEVFRTAVALLRVAMSETKAGHKLAIANDQNQVIKEIVLA